MKVHYDVIVVGGGPGGIASAVAAAREGIDVLLIERYGFLGGGATAMLVNPFMTFFAGDQQVVVGVFQDMLDKLSEMGAYGTEKEPTAFDTEAFKIAAERLCLEAGVELLYHGFLADAKVSQGKIQSVRIATKAGIKELSAKVYVDSTGDGDLAYFAGATIEKGREEDGFAQPMTLNFRMANVDIDRIPSMEEMTKTYIAAKAAGVIQCPREDILYFFATQPGVVHFNQTRVVKHDATDPKSMTEAEIEARRQAWQIAQWLVENVPGFEKAYLQQTAPQLGVRESRRVIGDYVLTAEELLAGCKFDDVIACGSYPVDIHNPTGEGTVIERLPPGKWYDIPYRCLTPLGLDNLLVGSRCISTTHAAHSAIRVIPIVFAIGHAAGVAAALAAAQGVTVRDIPYPEIQSRLLKQRAFLRDGWSG